MKQVASALVDGRLRYYLADSDTGELEEIAVVKAGPGFSGDPTAMVTMGFGLVHEAGWNGKQRPVKARAATAELPPAPEIVAEVEPPPAKRGPGRPKGTAGRPHHVTIEQIVEYVKQHPDGILFTDVASKLSPSGGRQTIDNRYRYYEARCEREGVAPEITKVIGEDARARLVPVTGGMGDSPVTE